MLPTKLGLAGLTSAKPPQFWLSCVPEHASALAQTAETNLALACPGAQLLYAGSANAERGMSGAIQLALAQKPKACSLPHSRLISDTGMPPRLERLWPQLVEFTVAVVVSRACCGMLVSCRM